jgi:glycosyltransferase involved in cell wall biosynthesis
MPTAPQSSPRIARIITRLNIGGPSIQAARLTTLLERRGYHTRLVHGRLGTDEGDMSDLVSTHDDVVNVRSLRRPIAPLDDARTFIRLFRLFQSFRPHIVHTHMAKAGLLGRMAAAAYNATRGSSPRARIVHTYHGHVLEGYFSTLISRTFIALEQLMSRRTDRLIAISPTICRELLDTFRIGGDAQYRVIPLGFDLSPFAAIDDAARVRARAALDVPANASVIATVGRLTAIKQPHAFLDTIARLAAGNAEIVALVAGDGELRKEARAHAAALGIDDRIRWLGWRRDLATIYAATDVFLLTSRNEGTPVALIEAMASGVAGVSTEVGGVTDVIDSPDVGIAVPVGNVAALAAAVQHLLDDSALRRRMGERARARVLEKYAIDRLVHDIDAMYRDLLSQP